MHRRLGYMARVGAANDPKVVNLAERRQPARWSLRGKLARLFLREGTPSNMLSLTAQSQLRLVTGRCHTRRQRRCQ
jgi:hypothetical protein